MLNKYMTACPQCGGYGGQQTDIWSEYIHEHEQLTAQYEAKGLSRSDAVEKAEAELKPPPDPQIEDCSKCKGTGFVPTREGCEILDFLARCGLEGRG